MAQEGGNEKPLFERDELNERLTELERLFTIHDHNPGSRTARPNRMATQDLTNYGRYSLTDGATITVPWTAANVFSVTLGGNRTFSWVGAQDGQVIVLFITQDGSGSRTVTWPSTVAWPSGSAPTLTTTADKTDVFVFCRHHSEDKEIGQIVGLNYTL